FVVKLEARDLFGNLTPGYRGTVRFTTTDTLPGGMPGDYTFKAIDKGRHDFEVTLFTTGPVASGGFRDVTATDNTVDPNITGSFTTQVLPGPVDHLSLETGDTATAGVIRQLTVAARDSYNNLVTDFTGTVTFRSSDPRAVRPDDYTFVADDHGKRSF